MFAFFERHGMLSISMTTIKAKKSLGQHFLRSKTALTQIVTAAHLGAGDTVLEIGPGEGALTEGLLATGARVVAVETDERCFEILRTKFAKESHEGRFRLIAGDIRETSVQEELFFLQALGVAPYKIVANIPYYITGMLFRLFLEHLRQPTQIVFLIQKEVADGIVARDGKEGILSLSVKAYGTPRIVAKVKREAFSPPPKVDSAIVSVEGISRTLLQGLSDEDYFRVVKAGLHAKRKMLLGNLSSELGIPRDLLEECFIKSDIASTLRGEDVPVEKWIALATLLTQQKTA